jgi:ubiquinone/menaquinone biosynthesis C-methylase UbiE
MTVADPENAASGAADDYRLSHLGRGGTYDAVLAGSPFDAYMDRCESRHLRQIIPALFPSRRPRGLDFACGTGRITEVVAPLYEEAVGVDISPAMLEQARRKCPTVKFVHADVTQTPLDEGSFDLATAFRFFGNAQDELRIAALNAIHGMLRPDAYLIINSHRNPHAIATLLHRITGGSTDMDLHYFKLRSLLHRCGFRIQRVIPIGAWMYRFKLQCDERDPAQAERLERRFGSAMLAPIAPDMLVVAKRVT